jgi:hypothetical protein
VTGKGKHLRDAMPHQSGANDRNLRFAHLQLSNSDHHVTANGAACGYPAV